MPAYVQLGPVNTWYDEQGEGSPLLLLHGGFLDARSLAPTLGPLAERFHVFTPERRGHGHTPDVEGPITYQVMAEDTIAFLSAIVGGAADLVGHSDGAIVALLVAMHRPELVKRLVLISGNYHVAGLVPGLVFEVDRLPPFLREAYGQVSPDGEAHFPVVAAKIAQNANTEPTLDASDLAEVRHRSLLVFADGDIVTLEHAVDMYRALPSAELAVVPGTSHLLTEEKPRLVNQIILDFLLSDPVRPMLPFRHPQGRQHDT